MAKRTIMPPDMDDLLAALKNNIFATLNCIQIGEINSYDKTTQSAEINIQVKRVKEDGKLVNYPLLVDCPVIVMQGGGAFIDFPIEKGDYCLIFFNDRNIDDWWLSGNVKEPKTKRKHNLSDGFCLVGVNTKNSALALDGNKVIINTNNKDFHIEGGTGTCNIKCSKVNIGGDATLTEEIIKGSSFLSELIIAFNAHTHTFTGQGAVQTPTVPWVELTNFPTAKSTNNKTS